jgi:DNA (cytosine-5)-methyltransferase 1
VSAYYNEIDPDKAEWLRELIRHGVIAPGDVDERDIKSVRADELAGYNQHHFFAGIGIWSYALRLSGWPDDRPVWTGSCPCPSFSTAGKGQGFDDPRHLWPDWFRLIREYKPSVVFGEQADDSIGYGWLDLVQTDLEAQDYSVGKAVLGACSVGAPHIRQRLYFVADNDGDRFKENSIEQLYYRKHHLESRRDSGFVDHSNEIGCGEGRVGKTSGERHMSERSESGNIAGAFCEAGELEHSIGSGLEGLGRDEHGGGKFGWFGSSSHRSIAEASPLNGFWRDAEWIPCRSLKVPGAIEWRPIEPGTFPLASGTPARILRLRGYGDGITAQVAQAFIESYMDARGISKRCATIAQHNQITG